MIIPDYVKETFLKLIKNIDNNDIIITGGIADYFNYKKHNIETGIMVEDIDILISNDSTLKDLENTFNNSSDYMFENSGYNNKQYYLWINEQSYIDIFLNDVEMHKRISTDKHDYDGYCFYTTDINQRYQALKTTLNLMHSSNKPYNTKIFKYLKKIMLYRRLIGNGI